MKYISRHVPPSPQQRELLEILIEECAEIQQAATKALRFGLDDGYPGGLSTNRQDLSRECGEFYLVMDLALDYGVLARNDFNSGYRNKLERLKQYMQTMFPEGDGK